MDIMFAVHGTSDERLFLYLCPNVSISFQPGQKATQCELTSQRKVYAFHWLVAEASSWFNILMQLRFVQTVVFWLSWI